VLISLLFTSLLIVSSFLVDLLGNLLADVLRRVLSTLADNTTIICKPGEELLKLRSALIVLGLGFIDLILFIGILVIGIITTVIVFSDNYVGIDARVPEDDKAASVASGCNRQAVGIINKTDLAIKIRSSCAIEENVGVLMALVGVGSCDN
jgi:Na+-transporting methylmalonyl-CoA/oxaloacetate decarboxylase gamma subunit